MQGLCLKISVTSASLWLNFFSCFLLRTIPVLRPWPPLNYWR